MEFKAVIIFLCFYFLRPQDWIGPLAGMNIVKPLMLIAIFATINRKDGFRVGEVIKTPVDWIMAIFFAYVIFTSEAPITMFKTILNLIAFFVVTTLALSNQQRLLTYLRWWALCIVLVATAGNLQMMGMDITHGAPLTELFKGRLALGTWMHNNPNALGHTVIAAIPLIYFTLMWRRPGPKKIMGAMVIAWCSWCVYATESKGSYLSGFITAVTSQIFGRPKVVQLMVLVLALTFGTAAMTQLPRMATLSQKEAGIQGRLIVWSIGYNNMRQNHFGVGWGKFKAEFRWEKEWVKKAPHSSYVMIGASLGYPGLWLYIACFYIMLKVVCASRARDFEEERIRRIIFVLVTSFMLSNWMIDRAYHTEFFLTAAVASAYYRLLYFRRSESAEEDAVEEIPADELELDFDPRLAGATGALGGGNSSMRTSWGLNVRNKMGPSNTMEVVIPPGGRLDDLPEAEAKKYRGINWTRLSVIDYVGITVLWLGVVKLWAYIVKHFCMFPQ